MISTERNVVDEKVVDEKVLESFLEHFEKHMREWLKHDPPKVTLFGPGYATLAELKKDGEATDYWVRWYTNILGGVLRYADGVEGNEGA